MKKFLYLCSMMLLCTDIMAQIDLNGFEYEVKKSISITSTLGEPVVSSSDKKNLPGYGFVCSDRTFHGEQRRRVHGHQTIVPTRRVNQKTWNYKLKS